jgi:tetratricopeptide (TPR) repeat protein
MLSGLLLPASDIYAVVTSGGQLAPAGGSNPCGLSTSTERRDVQQAWEDLRQAQTDFNAGRIKEALEKCRKALDLSPRAAEAYYLLGKIQDRRGARQEARQALLCATKLEPSLVPAHLHLGRIYLQSQELEPAAEEFRTVIRLGDNASADAHYGLGLALNAGSKYLEALPNLRAAVEARPADAARLFALGQCEVELARLDDVRNLSEIESVPEGRTTVPNDKYLAAISHLEKARVASPAADLSRTIEMELAVAYSHAGRDNEAAEIFQRLLKFWPESPQLHFNLGVVYGHLQRYTQAVAEFGQALKLKPDDDNARLAIAHVYLSYGRFKDAIPYLESYILRKPGYARAYQLLGRAYRREGQYSEAVKVLRKAVQLHPESYETRYDLGASLARLGETDQAIEQLEEAKKLKPDGSEAAYELGLLLIKKHGPQVSQKHLAQFEQLRDQTDQRMRAGVPNNQGRDLLQQGRVTEAVDAFREATKMDPGNAPFHYNLAIALARLGDLQGERQALQDAIKADPTFAKAHAQLGLSYMADGMLAEAEAEFKRALAINPQLAEAENNLGVLYGRLGKNTEAVQLFQKATEHSPQYVDALANLGLALADQGKYDEAQYQLQRAVAASPNNPGALTALGLIAQTTGRGADAVQLFKKVVKLQPDSLDAHLNLGAAMADQFNFPGALKEFSEAVRLAPDSAFAHFSKGRLLYDLANLHEAKAELDTAYHLSPGDPKALLLLALAEARMNNLPRAEELLNHLVKLDPRDADAHYLLGRVLLCLGKTNETLEQWQIASGLSPNNLKILRDLADLLSRLGKPEADSYAERLDALCKDQRLMDPVLRLDHFGMEAASIHDWPDAESQLKAALKLCATCEQSADLHRHLGVIYLRQGRIEGGKEEFHTVLRLNPNDSAMLKTLQVLDEVRDSQRGGSN